MTHPSAARLTLRTLSLLVAGAMVGTAVRAVVVVERSEYWPSSAAMEWVRPPAGGGDRTVLAPSDLGLTSGIPDLINGLSLMGISGAEGGVLFAEAMSMLAASAARSNVLESIALGPDDPGSGSVVDLAVIGAENHHGLSVPAPGSLPAGASDFIPEPGTIGFGLALLALGLGGAAKSVARCWRMTSARSDRGTK